jgi:murein tripeptide amidase MpaA
MECQSLLSSLTLHKFPNLETDGCRDSQQFLLRGSNISGENFHDAKNIVGQDNWEAKRGS